MSLMDNSGMYMPVAPAGYGGGNCGGFGWGDGSFWIIVLFLFAIMGNNGFGGWGAGNGMMPMMMNNTNNDVQRGFDQQALTTGIAANTAAINAMQNATTAGLNTVAMNLQNCCCENRAATADLKYTVATEACADRSAISNALQEVITQNAANTQRILDQMCQDKIDQKNDTIAQLRSQINELSRTASQNAQTAAIIANNEAQTAALEQYLAPVPRPAYVVQNPSCCNQGWGSCGCGNM